MNFGLPVIPEQDNQCFSFPLNHIGSRPGDIVRDLLKSFLLTMQSAIVL